MEISDSSMGIYLIGKVFGLAPYSVRKNPKGVYTIQKSILFLCYATALTAIMVSLTYRGLLFDANSKIPVRMKSATSKVVTSLDVSVVVSAILAGYLCGVIGLKATKELNARLYKADETLNSYNNLKWESLKKLALLSIPMLAILILLTLDIYTSLTIADNMKIDKTENVHLNVQWYIPFYGLYFVLTALHVLFANTALCLGRRFRFLNNMLRDLFLPEQSKISKEKPRIITVKVSASEQHKQSIASLSKLAVENYQNSGKNNSFLLRHIAELHESLGKCIKIVSSAYGMAVLIILISCFLHLVATFYFLFVGLLSKDDNGYVWLQVLWIIFHACRLLLVVEPCHKVSMESTKTIHIICEIERNVHDPIFAEEIKKFWQQLLVFDSSFSACGLCLVDRNLLTSLSSAIATYLVILIQFQGTNG